MRTLLVLDQSHVRVNKLSQPPHGWNNAVLNGIAYVYSRDSFIVTGKEWDLLFEIKLDYWKYI